MARIRSVHPGIWTDEAFMQISAMARLLIIGIWTEAFDDGVFEWKPIVLKARLFPADTCDVPALLAELESANIVRQVERGGKAYGLVRNFCKFQRPKKPNSSGVKLPEDDAFTGPVTDADERERKPVPNQSRTGSEKPPQMEDGGWNRSDDANASSVARERAKPPNSSPKTGHRLSATWEPRSEDWASAVERLGEAAARHELSQFRDHWAASNAPTAVKRDWHAAWRIWFRRASIPAATGPPGQFSGKRNAIAAIITATNRHGPNADHQRNQPDAVRLSVVPDDGPGGIPGIARRIHHGG